MWLENSFNSSSTMAEAFAQAGHCKSLYSTRVTTGLSVPLVQSWSDTAGVRVSSVSFGGVEGSEGVRLLRIAAAMMATAIRSPAIVQMSVDLVV